jgi:aryl carrier-like protein
VKQGDCSQLADIGQVGELVIEGPVVGRGYLGDAAKTEMAFIKRPAWMPQTDDSRGHGRLYRTGDLARYLENGVVCYAGRIDNQVKVRGQRLELEEVERKLITCLSTMDDVRMQHVVVEAVTLAGLSSKQLVAFLSLHTVDSGSLGYLDWENLEWSDPSSSDADRARFSAIVRKLESDMKLVLPSYAIPTVWIPMKSFPYAISRKIDRKQLRQLVAPLSIRQLSVFTSVPGATPATNGTSTHEVTENEAKLIDIWADVFGVDGSTVTLQDKFFQMGGDSLTAMRMVSIARQRGLAMTVADIVGAPTLAQLASIVRETATTIDLPPFSLVQDLDVTALRQEAVLQCGVSDEDLEDIYPCYAMQMHYITGYPEYERDLAGPWHWQSQQVYRVPQSMDLERFRAVWDNAVRRHQLLRTRLILSATGVFQVVVKAGTGPSKWEEADALEAYLENDKSRIMGFGDELLRLAVVHTQGSSNRFFVLTMQHLIYDAFSLGILFNELEQDYFGEGLPSQPRPTMNRFIQYITGTDKSAALDFWTSYLAGAATKPLLTFPPNVKLFDLDIREASVTTRVPESGSWRSPEATTATIMEVAGGLAIASRLGCADVVLYSDRSGRNLPVEGIQDLVSTHFQYLENIHRDVR